MKDQIEKLALRRENGVLVFSENRVSPDFEEGYIAIREKEGRTYSDAELKGLPNVGKGHRHYSEWRIRRSTLEKLMNYLFVQSSGLRILDLGCGNGWMSHHLANLQSSAVFAVDLSQTELAQAARVFGDQENLHFGYGDIFDRSFDYLQFDIITMGASFQYFPSASDLISRLQSLLSGQGEIHILDTPFYTEKEAPAARERTITYYAQMGYPSLAEHYYAHTWKELERFSPALLYNPSDWFSRVLRAFPWNYESPFPWLVIRK